MIAATAAADRWITVPQPRPDAGHTLICFHHAGGDASAYRTWPRELPDDVEVRTVQLPGRHSRLGEELYTSITAITDVLAPLIAAGTEQPYSFFGHSMGALLAYETSRWLHRHGHPLPRLLMVSGRAAPSRPPINPPLHALPTDEFIREIIRMDGTPKEVFDHPDLAEMVVRILRADLTAVETYQDRHTVPLACTIAAFAGTADVTARVEDVAGWSAHTSAGFVMDTIEGGHFFLRDQAAGVPGRVARLLASA